MKALVIAGATAALVAGVATALTTPAFADSRDGCPYPYACTYSTKAKYDADSPTGKFKAFTSNFQMLRYVGPYAVVNTRNNDGVLLLGRPVVDPGGEIPSLEYCLGPNKVLKPGSVEVDGFRIMDDPKCNGQGAGGWK